MKLLAGLFGVAVLAIMASSATSAHADSSRTAIGTLGSADLVARFLAGATPQLTSYRARRTLTAATKGGGMTASLDAWTSVSPSGRFAYEIISARGSDVIRHKVFIPTLEEERRAREQNDTGGELTPENYSFEVDDDRSGDLLRIFLHPRRKSSMLVDGTAFVTSDGFDMVRMEGELSKRPSFWTRRVEIIRHYARIGGVRVPIEMHSRADVRLVGDSTFSMRYDYVEVNGQPVVR